MSDRHAPVVTIVGIPNTGKSTLFNRLLGKRKALIHSIAGMTRDIMRGRVEINDRFFFLQDSGGFFPQLDTVSQEINKRIYKEIDRSDLILFLFDGRRELMAYEKEFFLEVKKRNHSFIPVMNKVDAPEKFMLPVSYYSLKLDMTLISAEHNIGIDDLLDRIIKMIPVLLPTVKQDQSMIPLISIIGKPNVGKSSIINRLVQDEWTIVSPRPGTTRDSIDLEMVRNNHKWVIIDNAGIRKLQKVKEETESAAVIRAEKYMARAEVLIFVIDLSRPLDQTDFLVAKKVIQSAKPTIIAANKWDLLPESDRGRSMKSQISKVFPGLYYAPVVPVSAKTGKDVFELIDRAHRIHLKLIEKIKTRKLNDTVLNILHKERILDNQGRPFIPKFISIESTHPFFLLFHGRTIGRLRPSDEIHVKRMILNALSLEGIPLFFKTIAAE